MESTQAATPAGIASGEKAKARDIIAAIRILNRLDEERRTATEDEKKTLARFGGFGPVALSLFPDPITGKYKDQAWQSLGTELQSLLSGEDYDSAKRTTFNAFYTSPTVIRAIHGALGRLGAPDNATVLEPGCGIGNFMGEAPEGMHFIGVELDRTSGRIARALHPGHDIRIENFRDTRLPENGIDAVIGNVPFADVKLTHHGQRFSLHDYFFAKSVNSLKPGGLLALVTSHYTLDKQNAAIREYLAERADFLGAIRLPSDAFKREGTAVVTDIVFLRKRAPGEKARHADPSWMEVAPLAIDGADIPINRYFLNHPEMVLGSWSRKDTLYGGEGFSIIGNGNLEEQLRNAIHRLPEFEQARTETPSTKPQVSAFTPPPPLNHIAEGSFFVGDDKIIRQVQDGQTVPVVYGGVTLKSDGTMMGRRLAALIGLRDEARRVLQSQNEGWPEQHRVETRRSLNRAYDRFVAAYGPINKTTLSEKSDGGVIRRMPNVVKFREDPDAMLVMSLEDYDETTGKAAKAAILQKDVVGRTPAVQSVRSAEEGLLVSLDHRGGVDLAYIAQLYGKSEADVAAELGDLIYLDPDTKAWETADAYLSGNVRAKLAIAEHAGPRFARNAEALRAVQTGGSERAFDLFMKCRYLDELHAGHGVTFATGTPISNTMVEMYTMQRFLDPKGLAERGIEHFDAWAATFGEVVDTMEISPDGASLRPRSRFAKFTNLPELQQMFRAFSDVQTAEMLDLPRPQLKDGKPIVVACPMSEEQSRLQQELVARYERIRSEKVDPREDNALAITTDGRKLALDARMLSAAAEDNPRSKVSVLVENVERIWRDSAGTRGTQMIFCDMGVHPTPWGYSVYNEVIEKLASRGIPRDQIAAIGDADSDARKQALFEKVRQGSVRVLIGSTQKMGTGTNVQKRLVALHHLDAPWKPAEVEQREGRILRQGNENPEVAIYRYVTEGSFDAYMWQALETKARFISQIMTGDAAVRRAEDIGGQELSYAEVKAIASGNPAVLTLSEADAELQRLAVLRKNHADEQFLARRNLRELPETIQRLKRRIHDLETDQATIATHADAPTVIGSQKCHRDDVAAILGKRLDALPEKVSQPTRIPLGTCLGLAFGIVLHSIFAPEVYLEGATTRQATLSREHQGPRAVLNALSRLSGSYGELCDKAGEDLALADGQLRDYQARIGKPFAHEGYFAELTALRDQLKDRLSNAPTTEGDSHPSAAELAERIKELKAAHVIEGTPQRTVERRVTTAEEPVTARLRRRMNVEPTFEPEADANQEPKTAESPQPAEKPLEPQHPNAGDAVSEDAPNSRYRERFNRDNRRKPRQLSLF